MTMTIGLEGHKRMMQCLKPFLMKDATRPSLSGYGLSLTKKDRTPILHATDGHTLRILPLAAVASRVDGKIPELGCVIQPATLLEALFPCLSENGPTSFTLPTRGAHAPSRVEEVIPSSGAVTYRVARKELLAKVKAAIVLAKRDTKALREAWLPQAKARLAKQKAQHLDDVKAYQEARKAWTKACYGIAPRARPKAPTRPSPPQLAPGPDVEDSLVLDGTEAGGYLNLACWVDKRPVHRTRLGWLLAEETHRRSQMDKEDATAVFQGSYLVRALASFPNETELELTFSGSLHPLVVRPARASRDPWDVAVIMPVAVDR